MNKVFDFFNIRKARPFKVNALIVGAQKAGTSALHSILNGHSKIIGGNRKEMHFFDSDSLTHEFNYGLYESHFNYVGKGNIYFEATPSYLYHPKAAKRIYKYNENIKIIISLRDPAERALSAWTMYHHHFKNHKQYGYLHDDRSFKDAIESELNDIDSVNWYTNKVAYVKRGIYYNQVKQYLLTFPSNNIFILESNKFKKEPSTTIKKICDFLCIGYEELKVVYENQRKVNNTSKHSKELEKLRAFYEPYNDKLFELIDQKFNWY